MQLPDSWALPAVAEVGAVRSGRQRSPQKQSGLFPTEYLRAANIGVDGLDLSEVYMMDFTPVERTTFRLRRGDVVLAEASGSASQVGRAAIWREELPLCCFQNTVLRFRPHAASSEYALIVFRHYAASGEFAHTSRGVGILHLGASRLAALKFPLPPLPEQLRIAEAFETRAEALREAEGSLRSALSRTHEQDAEILAAAVAGELLEDSGGVRRARGASARSRDPVDSSTEATMPRAHRQPDPLPDGDLPEGWRWVRVDEAGDVTLGKKREPTSHRGPHMRPYLRVANVQENRIDLEDVKEMNFTPHEFETYALRPGDILLNEGQSPELVGRPAMYRGEMPGVCFQMTLLRFRAFEVVDPEFALIVFRHYLRAGNFRRSSRWSTNIAHLSRRRLEAMPFPLPPLDEQRRIASAARHRLDASEGQRAGVAASLERLAPMSAELLAAAVSGQLVPQDPNDEPASELLERMGPPPHDVPAVDLTTIEDWEQRMSTTSPEVNTGAASERSLAEALTAAGGPLALPALCAAAGFDTNDTAEIERFYLALRTQVGTTLRVAGDAEENALVEVASDASR